MPCVLVNGPTCQNPSLGERCGLLVLAAMAIAWVCQLSAVRQILTQSYNGNILVNAMTVGVADKEKIFYSAAKGAGNPVVYVGLENRA